jgi:hypothetical protein
MRFEIVNSFAIRAGIDRHNAKCPIPADAVLLNPIDHGLMGYQRLWGFPVLPEATVTTKCFRIRCEGSAAEIEHELSGYQDGV